MSLSPLNPLPLSPHCHDIRSCYHQWHINRMISSDHQGGRTYLVLDWKLLQVHPISQGLALRVIWLAGERKWHVSLAAFVSDWRLSGCDDRQLNYSLVVSSTEDKSVQTFTKLSKQNWWLGRQNILLPLSRARPAVSPFFQSFAAGCSFIFTVWDQMSDLTLISVFPRMSNIPLKGWFCSFVYIFWQCREKDL